MVENGPEMEPAVTVRRRQVEAIVAEHEQPLLRYAARILGDATAAEDVVQNVFVKLFRGWGEDVDPAGHLKAWLYRVTHNEAVDHLRRQARLHLVGGEQAENAVAMAVDERPGPGGEDERRALVLQQLKSLHPREQQVLLLRLEEGLSYEEISAVTGRSIGNVGNLLHHAVRKLSERLERAGVRPAGGRSAC